MKHKFIVDGPCIPYTRVTQRSKYVNRQWKRYAGYKVKVLSAFLNSIKDEKLQKKYLFNIQKYGKPICTGDAKVYVFVEMYFVNRGHGDPDNIFKGCLDSLFVSDKYVAGGFDFNYNKKNPRIEVEIKL